MSGSEVIRIISKVDIDERNFAWISFQADNSISVGLSDRLFRLDSIELEMVNGERVVKESVDLASKFGTEAITNPHFTFHPPIYHHLRSAKQQELWVGYMEVDKMLNQVDRVPWIKIESNPFNELSPCQGPRSNQIEHHLLLPCRDASHSVGIEIDFIRSTTGSKGNKVRFKDRFFLDIRSLCHSGTKSNIIFYWQG